MKRQLLLLMAIGTLAVHGQPAEKNKLNKTFNKILIGFSISPDYNDRVLKNNNGTANTNLIISSRDKQENGRIGFTAGFNICFSLTNKAELETGTQYSLKGYQTAKYDLVYIVPDPAAPISAKFLYNYHYIDIPLKINILKGNRRLRFIGSAGFVTNILFFTTVTQELDYGGGKSEIRTSESNYNYKKINISPMVSFGADYRLNHKMYLRAGPVFRYGMLNIINTPISERLWNAGLNMGFYYRLK